MKNHLRPALVIFAIFTLICGVIYPFAIAGIGNIAFPEQSTGSLVVRNGQPIGSILIGQAFSSPHYFWGRPSATSPMPNNGTASGGSNLGPSNPVLIEVIKQRTAVLKASDPTNTAPIPVDLVTASASGLDPDISLNAAYYQADRVANERQLSIKHVQSLIDKYSQKQYFGFWGEPRINVLQLNIALDQGL
jgi:K+-transporting ATPase ATPase C chain